MDQIDHGGAPAGRSIGEIGGERLKLQTFAGTQTVRMRHPGMRRLGAFTRRGDNHRRGQAHTERTARFGKHRPRGLARPSGHACQHRRHQRTQASRPPKVAEDRRRGALVEQGVAAFSGEQRLNAGGAAGVGDQSVKHRVRAVEARTKVARSRRQDLLLQRLLNAIQTGQRNAKAGGDGGGVTPLVGFGTGRIGIEPEPDAIPPRPHGRGDDCGVQTARQLGAHGLNLRRQRADDSLHAQPQARASLVRIPDFGQTRPGRGPDLLSNSRVEIDHFSGVEDGQSCQGRLRQAGKRIGQKGPHAGPVDRHRGRSRFHEPVGSAGADDAHVRANPGRGLHRARGIAQDGAQGPVCVAIQGDVATPFRPCDRLQPRASSAHPD